MKVIHGRAAGADSERRSATFTGEVWADPVLAPTDGVTINNVFFAPGARTHWHTHERGQILFVVAGHGRVLAQGGAVQAIRAGDTVWIGPGERHWHGAAQSTYMIHLAVSLGDHEWQEPVSDEDYGRNGGGTDGAV
jgi:quercetin dioxygenase-like cupin family protein